ncbi:MAG TPA: glycosyltransferase family 39 protein, partial [Woeseiaceae bacterium]|nr:glycosyltransferase family 39 protein [Woeseiaceae bacterium]
MNGADARKLAWLFVIAVAVLAAGLGLREPWPADEPRFALIAKDMVESGDWLIPRVGGVLYPDKPPLFFWLVASFYALTNSISVAVLLPSLLAGLGVLWLVYDLARRLWTSDIGIWSAAALLATVQFPLQMKAGQIDGVLCFWTTLGLYGLSRHLLLGPDWRWLAIAGAACGLGVITKGVGFLPLLLLLPYLYARSRGWNLPAIGWCRGRWLLLPAAFFLAIALWLVPMLLVTTGSGDPELLQYRDNILFRQTVTRYADAWGHIKPPWYLWTNALPWLWLPFTLLFPWLIPGWARELKARNAATLLLGAWVLLVLLFFSISEGKRSLYIFPALPALALLAGPALPQLVARAGPRRALFALGLSLPLLMVVAGVYALAEPGFLQAKFAAPEMARSLAFSIAAIGLAGTAAVLAFRPRRAAFGYAAIMAIIWSGVSLLVYPRIDATRSGEAIIEAAARVLGPDESLGFAGWKEQFLLQWNRPAVHFGYRRNDAEGEIRDAAGWLSASPDHRLLLPQRMIEPCFDGSHLLPLGTAHRQQWLLADQSAVLPECRAA